MATSNPRPEVSQDLLERLRAICLLLPEVVEEQAWAGIRWTVRKRNFAHVVAIDEGWPPAYAEAAGTPGPAHVLTFRSSGEELEVLSRAGPPFFKPVWFEGIVGMVLGEDPDAVDWQEVAELVTESYLLLAPKALAAQVQQS